MNQPIPFITRVRIANYKSIAACDVELGPLKVLLGLNAAGKSNFLDVLSFVADALSLGPRPATAKRGGPEELARQVDGPLPTVSVELQLQLAVTADTPTVSARYGFELRFEQKTSRQPVAVAREWCHIGSGPDATDFVRTTSHVEFSSTTRAARSSELWLGTAALEDSNCSALYSALCGISFHTPDPQTMRGLELRASGNTLGEHGERLGEVLGELAKSHPAVKSRIDDYLGAIAPGALGMDQRVLDTHSTVQLRMLEEDSGSERQFNPGSISDGTLRAAGLLAALFQPDSLTGEVPLVCVDEPELGLHPTATGVLFDALTEAAEHVQVIAATQSADLLDRKDFDPDWALLVTMENGATQISPVDEGTREVVARRLATLGEELRSNQLTPRPVPAFLRQEAQD
jgi:predicted ATPase